MGNMMTSPPRGANRPPNFGPSCGGPARPLALHIPTPTSGAGPPRRCLRHRVAPAGARCGQQAAKYRFNRARRGGVWGGATVPRVVAPGRATASGNATPKHGARVALGAYMGASPHPPFPLVSSREGCRRWPSRPWRGGRSPPRGLGVQPPAVEPP